VNQIKWIWDDEKARTNLAKHEIAFSEAALVFEDPLHASNPIRIRTEIAGRRLAALGHFWSS
jgi:uncharacterized DUF497 family protein